MGVNQQYTRINTLELKSILHQKIGQQRAEKYFNLLNKLLNLQLTKSNFDKFCIRTIGRENLPLHNRLISSIVKNASLSKTPPPKIKKLSNSLNVKVSNPNQKNNLQSLYGDAFPSSPRKNRSPRDRKFKDRFSPLGPGFKVQPEQHQSPTELHSLGSRPIEVLSVEDGEEAVSGSPGVQSKSPVTAPLGISLKMNDIKARKTPYRASFGLKKSEACKTCQESCELPDSGNLRVRLRQKLEVEGLSVSEDCANLLNVGLDAYLKRLMEPCIRLARSRANRAGPGTFWERPRVLSGPCLLDFRVGLECDAQKLGGDWSMQLEKLRFSGES